MARVNMNPYSPSGRSKAAYELAHPLHGQSDLCKSVILHGELRCGPKVETDVSQHQNLERYRAHVDEPRWRLTPSLDKLPTPARYETDLAAL